MGIKPSHGTQELTQHLSQGRIVWALNNGIGNRLERTPSGVAQIVRLTRLFVQAARVHELVELHCNLSSAQWIVAEAGAIASASRKDRRCSSSRSIQAKR
jgi:hypothetical protein